MESNCILNNFVAIKCLPSLKCLRYFEGTKSTRIVRCIRKNSSGNGIPNPKCVTLVKCLGQVRNFWSDFRIAQWEQVGFEGSRSLSTTRRPGRPINCCSWLWRQPSLAITLKRIWISRLNSGFKFPGYRWHGSCRRSYDAFRFCRQQSFLCFINSFLTWLRLSNNSTEIYLSSRQNCRMYSVWLFQTISKMFHVPKDSNLYKIQNQNVLIINVAMNQLMLIIDVIFQQFEATVSSSLISSV